jgi:hypothetical protein
MKESLKVVVVCLLALITGFIGAGAFFSDLGRNETLVGRVVPVVIIYFVASSIIGAIYEQRWYLAVFTSWGPMLLFVIAFMNMLVILLTKSAQGPQWSFLLALSIVPVFALVSGYAGAWLRRRYRN